MFLITGDFKRVVLKWVIVRCNVALGVHKLDSVAIQFDICCFGEGAWTE